MKKGSKLEETLAWQIKVCGLPKPEREYVFLPGRRYRADFAWPAPKVRLIVECQGGLWLRKGAHSSGTGIRRDYEKSNCAQLDGWVYLQFTADQIKSGLAVQVIESFIRGRMA